MFTSGWLSSFLWNPGPTGNFKTNPGMILLDPDLIGTGRVIKSKIGINGFMTERNNP